jgi:hypothetical protein
VSPESLPQPTKRDVGHTTSSEPPADIAFYTVDREEVDRLRKRFMKLDKVRPLSPSAKYTIQITQASNYSLTDSSRRTAPAQSSAKNSCNSPKSPPTLWQHA